MRKIISVILMSVLMLTCICATAATYSDGNTGYGQSGEVWVFHIAKDTGIKTNFIMNSPENGGPMLDDTYGALMSMRPMCANLNYEYKEMESGYYYISNGLRTIIIPKDRQVAYVDGAEKDFEYSEMNDDIYFPYQYLDMLFDIETDWDNDTLCLTLTERESTPVSDEELLFRKESATLSVFSENNEIGLNLNDQEISFADAKPFIDDADRTQVPVRAVAEMLECNVDWDDTDETVTVTDGNNVVKLKVGSDVINVCGADIKMDTSAIIKDDRTYIPLRFAAEALGLTVEWEG